MDESSGVGVLDKAVAIASAVAAGPASLSELAARTGLPRPTAHRIAIAMEHHGLIGRDDQGRFVLGPTPALWAGIADPLVVASHPVVVHLRDATRESAQVYRQVGARRLCVAAAEPESGLRDTVPVGAMLTMSAGSAAQVLLAWREPAEVDLRGAAFTRAGLDAVVQQGWAHSAGQREPGVASIAAPVRDQAGTVVAAVSISGPVERLETPAPDQVAAVLAAAAELSDALR